MTPKQTRPKISVIMTVFNGERYLADAVQSILDQSMREFELLVVNDTSTDGTRAILEGFACGDERVQIISNGENRGPYPSANIALERAQAPLIARMDADDVSAPDRLARQLAFMDDHPDCLLVGGGYRSIDADGKQRFLRHNAMGFDACAFVTRLRMPMVHPSFCFRAKLPDGSPVRYDETIPIAGDYALAAKLASAGRVASLDAIVVQYRMHADNISSTKLDRQQHYAHATSSSATARHYPAEVSANLSALLDVLYGRAQPTSILLATAVKGVDAAIAFDCKAGKNPAIEERAAGILAEAFAAALPPAFLTKAPHHMLALLKRYGRLRNVLPQLPM